MTEIKGVSPGGPVLPPDVEHERLKEVKSRAGLVAFIAAYGKKAFVAKVSTGITRSEGALKWIEEVFKQK